MESIDINEVTISINEEPSQTETDSRQEKNPTSLKTQKTTPSRSSATALDIYSEIRNTKEKELLKIIDEQRSKIAELENEVSTLRVIAGNSTDIGERDGKKRKRTDGSADDHTIQERQNLKKQVENLTEKLEEREHELHEVREQLAESEWNHTPSSKDSTSDLCYKIEKLIDKKMSKIEKKIANIEQKQTEGTEEVKLSFANVAAKSIDNSNVITPNKDDEITKFREIAQAARMEDIHEENEKKNRENNIILHGVAEGTEEEDKALVNSLIKEVCIGAVHPRLCIRVGTKNATKNRPIKVTFNSLQEKAKLMSNLSNLKGKESFSKISITHDYTVNERQLIQQFINEAKIRNEQMPSEDDSYKWQVRGSPKNRLFLKKVMKRKVNNLA